MSGTIGRSPARTRFTPKLWKKPLLRKASFSRVKIRDVIGRASVKLAEPPVDRKLLSKMGPNALAGAYIMRSVESGRRCAALAERAAALFFYSRNRNGEHPNRHLAGYAGILQADAYAGFGDLYDARRRPSPITEAACWSHGRRKFFALADLGKSPLAVEAVRRIDAIFAIEREINGIAVEQRLAIRAERIKPLVGELEEWMRTERARLSRHADISKAMDYMLKCWPAFTRVLD